MALCRGERGYFLGVKLALKLFVCTVILASGVALAKSPQVPRDPSVYFFNTTLGDYREELKTAREQGRQGILLFFEMDECPFCHRMKTTVLNQPQVQNYFREHFLIFPIDIEGDIEVIGFDGRVVIEKDFAFRQNRVRATPVFAFFDLTGNRIVRYTGATSGIVETLLLGKYVVDGIYKDMSFTRYKRSQREQ
ncbi:MAG TPA: thioredoxin [Chromatiaceae bacterium]|nr:thioredoxin [Chromatiaceae bacterium]HIN82986.1 thioredoxin [Chromatiales bacterium]HIA07898.1 thioredoxin [Chromatiaceae bacterium]HIB84960.1 thioredoxin [Chromatiaceae bacterium]HIO15097.1 thioredoxin [Chromatiales bacterium]